MIRIALISLFILFNSYSTSAQEQLDAIGRIFNMIGHWRNSIDSFFVKEDAGRLSRNLGYLYQDFGDYLTIRKNLTDGLEKVNFRINNRDSVKALISSVSASLGRLYLRTKDINSMLISGTASRIDSAILWNASTESTLMEQRVAVLTVLSDYLYNNKPVDIGLFKKEARRIYRMMEKSRQTVLETQNKVKEKFQIARLTIYSEHTVALSHRFPKGTYSAVLPARFVNIGGQMHQYIARTSPSSGLFF